MFDNFLGKIKELVPAKKDEKKTEISRVANAFFERLLAWAESEGIDDLTYDTRFKCERGIPRDKQKLLLLRDVNISRSNIAELPKELFFLGLIMSLNVRDNRLQILPREISNLKNLNFLDASHNAISELPSELCYLPHLRVIRMGSNKLTFIPNDIGSLENLEFLDLNNNEIKMLPSDMFKAKKIKMLSLWKNALTELSHYIGELENLEELNIANNLIEKLPKSIRYLKNLVKMDIRNNKLYLLPKEIGELASLKELDAGNDLNLPNINQIMHLPPEFGALQNLQSLNLCSNSLLDLPNEIGLLTNLTKLNLANNKIDMLPYYIENLINLRDLDISANRLKKLPPEIMKLTLTRLDISDNPELELTPEQQEWLKTIQIVRGGIQNQSADKTLAERIAQHMVQSEIPAAAQNVEKIETPAPVQANKIENIAAAPAPKIAQDANKGVAQSKPETPAPVQANKIENIAAAAIKPINKPETPAPKTAQSANISANTAENSKQAAAQNIVTIAQDGFKIELNRDNDKITVIHTTDNDAKLILKQNGDIYELATIDDVNFLVVKAQNTIKISYKAESVSFNKIDENTTIITLSAQE
ncbi:MAG: leucine-rich repeat domain-containing protein [Campylobacteraceae bacterium]|jgi:Leucine-rich repeat (LRR) protein|nr:leucine-rich repeat domain-containing protein [Campylobacteraceae bacterium]